MDPYLTFFHSLPRTGSTWLAYKFADRPNVALRFEPFHENLIAGKHVDLQKTFERLRFGRSLRHPHREKHYHSNYELRPEGGARLFRKRFCYQNYYMRYDDADLELLNYLNSLTQVQRGNKVVFKSTKSALRMPWLARNVPGAHIYIVRSPRLIDNSFFSFRGYSNPYIRDLVVIVGQNGRKFPFRGVATWGGLNCWVGNSVSEEYAHYRYLTMGDRRASYSRQFYFDCVCFLWAFALALATRNADLIIDMETLQNRKTRERVEYAIGRLAGIDVDLSDYHVDRARLKRVFERHRVCVSPGMVKIIRAALSSLDVDWCRALNFDLSEGTRRAVHFLAGTAVTGGSEISKGSRGKKLGDTRLDTGELFCWRESRG